MWTIWGVTLTWGNSNFIMHCLGYLNKHIFSQKKNKLINEEPVVRYTCSLCSQGASWCVYSPWQLRWLQPVLLQPGWPGIGQPWSWLADVREDESICTFPESISLWCNPYTRWLCCHWCQSLCCQQDEQTDNRFLLCCSCHAGTLDIPARSVSARGSVNVEKQQLSEDFHLQCKTGERRLQRNRGKMFCKQCTKYLDKSLFWYTSYNPFQ